LRVGACSGPVRRWGFRRDDAAPTASPLEVEAAGNGDSTSPQTAVFQSLRGSTGRKSVARRPRRTAGVRDNEVGCRRRIEASSRRRLPRVYARLAATSSNVRWPITLTRRVARRGERVLSCSGPDEPPPACAACPPTWRESNLLKAFRVACSGHLTGAQVQVALAGGEACRIVDVTRSTATSLDCS